MNTIMSDEQVKAFYNDIAAVMRKHKVRAVAGVWVGSLPQHGMIKIVDATDLTLKMQTDIIAEKWKEFLAASGVPVDYTERFHEVNRPDELNN